MLTKTSLDSNSDKCELCLGNVMNIHCKIICQQCGFTRDCSDP